MSSASIKEIQKQISEVILGKEDKIKLVLSCLIAGGNLLIEDLPGMGKTTLAQAIALSLGLDYNRVQFTSDLLPADILGVSIFDQKESTFEFKKGPIFSNLLLADEINRASPKTQSALLEAMEEGRVSVDGKTYDLPQPFIVVATQNPNSQMGTYPLPESQLDRFLMRISLGYPSEASEKALISGENPREKIQTLKAVCDSQYLLDLREKVKNIHMTPALTNYIFRLVQQTRESADLRYGLSPRGTIALTRSAQAWALVNEREHVVPDDVQAVFAAVVEHRVKGLEDYSLQSSLFSEGILDAVDVIAA